jgi:hypothetical protein
LIGLAVPGRPLRSLVAEDRSAEAVRDRTGPENPWSVLGPVPHRDPRGSGGHQRSPRDNTNHR